MLRVFGIAGSLRRGSYNRSLLRAAIELAPKELEFRVFDQLGEIPLYDADREAERIPDAVEALRTAMREAGLERVKTALAWEHEVPRLLAAYEELFKCDTSR